MGFFKYISSTKNIPEQFKEFKELLETPVGAYVRGRGWGTIFENEFMSEYIPKVYLIKKYEGDNEARQNDD